jgi:hypothetical protein
MSLASTITDMLKGARSFDKNLCNCYCSLPSVVVSKSTLSSQVFWATKCSKKGSIGLSRTAMCESCTTLICPCKIVACCLILLLFHNQMKPTSIYFQIYLLWSFLLCSLNSHPHPSSANKTSTLTSSSEANTNKACT